MQHQEPPAKSQRLKVYERPPFGRLVGSWLEALLDGEFQLCLESLPRMMLFLIEDVALDGRSISGCDGERAVALLPLESARSQQITSDES